MKKISILISKQNLELPSTLHSLSEYIYNYINYKLSPYKRLGVFAYNTYPYDQNFIDGTSNPQKLIEHIYQIPCILKNVPFASIVPYIDDCNFFNAESGCFYLTTDEYEKIIYSPQNYCIVFSNIYH